MNNLQQKKHFKKLAKLQEKRKARLKEKQAIEDEAVAKSDIESEEEEQPVVDQVEQECQKGINIKKLSSYCKKIFDFSFRLHLLVYSRTLF